MRTILLTATSLVCVAACANDSPATSALTRAALSVTAAGRGSPDPERSDETRHRARFEHVMLLSIDGMHQRDLESFLASHPGSALAGLSARGVQYENAFVNRLDGTPTNPSDSFPGLLALTTGGSSPTHGGWYDVSFARDLYAYDASAPCSGAPGTSVTYDESIELDASLSSLWGSTADNFPTHDPAAVRARLDVTKLPYRKAAGGCSPVYPHDFIRANTIFEVAHRAGLHTAWSDKHLAYELVSGPSGKGLADFFAPEINSAAKNLVPSAASSDDFTTLYTETEVYDDFKVQALLNEIDGKWSDDGLSGAQDTQGPQPGVPAIFGMNFQALSVAQKDAKSGKGGYADAHGTPNAEVAAALEHTDSSLAKLRDRLSARSLLDSTLIIVTAKHGQSPIDPSLVHKIDGDAVAALVNAVAPLAAHIEDDVALYWLKDGRDAAKAAAALKAGSSTLDPAVERVFTRDDEDFARMFGDPARDSHVPDVVVQPKPGVIYSLSAKKLAEHGGFAEDDAHVCLLVSNPSLDARIESRAVRTKQVAPTILRALGLKTEALDAVRREGTEVLPGLDD